MAEVAEEEEALEVEVAEEAASLAVVLETSTGVAKS